MRAAHFIFCWNVAPSAVAAAVSVQNFCNLVRRDWNAAWKRPAAFRAAGACSERYIDNISNQRPARVYAQSILLYAYGNIEMLFYAPAGRMRRRRHWQCTSASKEPQPGKSSC